jgi:hypothetical protein
MLRAGLLLAASMIVAGPVCAQTDQVRRGRPPTWIKPSTLLPLPATMTGPVFFRRQDVEVHLSDKGQAQYLGYRIKLLDSAACSSATSPFLGTLAREPQSFTKSRCFATARSLTS